MLWYCQQCTTAYAVGLVKCPHCGQPTAELLTVPAETAAPAREADEAAKPRRKPHADG